MPKAVNKGQITKKPKNKAINQSEKKDNIVVNRNKRSSQSKFKTSNNQGFTLIEILGVIVIIGILISIGSLAVTKYVETTKVATYESYKEDLSGAANNFMVDCVNSNGENCIIPGQNEKVKLRYDKLVDNGYTKVLKDPESDGFCDQSFVIVSNDNKDAIDLKYQVCLFCDKYKSTDGDCQEALKWEDDYLDDPVCDGDSCEDPEIDKPDPTPPCEGDECNKPTDPENPPCIGKECEDPTNPETPPCIGDECSGNDKTPPTCDYSKIIGNSTEWTNKDRTIEIGCSDEGSGCKKEVYSKTFSPKTGEIIEKGYITIEDKEGNKTNCPVDVYIDKTLPTCKMKFNGTMVNGWYPKTTATMIEKADNGSGIKEFSTIAVVGSENKSKITDNDFQTNLGKSETDEMDTTSPSWYALGMVKDNAGNVATCEITGQIDVTPPTIEVVNSYDNIWTNHPLTISLKLSDENRSGLKDFGYKKESVLTYNKVTSEKTQPYFLWSDEYEGKINIQACDKLDNCNDSASTIVKLDMTEPTASPNAVNVKLTQTAKGDGKTLEAFVPEQEQMECSGNKCEFTACLVAEEGSWEWNYNDFQKQLNLKDINGVANSGINYDKITVNHEMLDKDGKILQGDSCLTSEGNKPCQYKWSFNYMDNAGNTGEPVKVNIKVDYTNNPDSVCYRGCVGDDCDKPDEPDTTGPTCDYSKLKGNSTEWTNKDRTIEIGCSDEESGCKKEVYSQTFSPAKGEMIQQGKIIIEDNAGNQTACSVDVYIDKIEPTCKMTFRGSTINGWYAATRAEMVSKSDNVSNITEFSVIATSSNYESKIKESDYLVNESLTNTTSGYTGNWVALGKVKDEAGNVGTCKVNANIDVTPPTVSVVNDYDNIWTNQSYTITLNLSDHNQSGLKSYGYKKEDVLSYKVTNSDEAKPYIYWAEEYEGKVNFRACDNLNNCNTNSSTTVKLDKTKPTATPSAILVTPTQTAKDDGRKLASFVPSQKQMKCTGNTCEFTVCLVDIVGNWTWNYEDFSSRIALKDIEGLAHSGINNKSISLTYTMYDKNGEETLDGACLTSRHDNPCQYKWYYNYKDNAGNAGNSVFININVDYINNPNSICYKG